MTARDKQFLIGGAVFIVFYVLYLFVAEPLYKKNKSAVQDIENKILFIQKYFAVINQESLYQQQEQANQQIRTQLEQRFLDENQPGLAAAQLQKILEELSRQSGVEMPRVRVEKARFVQGLLSVPIEVTLLSTTRGLTQFIRSVESHQKFLVIEELNSRISAKGEPEKLQTRLLISGFIHQFESGDKQNT